MPVLLLPLVTRTSHAYEIDASAWADRGPLPEGLHAALEVLFSATTKRAEIAAAWDHWDLERWNPNDLVIRSRQFRVEYSFAEWAVGRETSLESESLGYFMDRGLDLTAALNRLIAQYATGHTEVLVRKIQRLLDKAPDDALRQAYPLFIKAGYGLTRTSGQGSVLHQFVLAGDTSLFSRIHDRMAPLVDQGLASTPDRALPALLKRRMDHKDNPDVDWARHAWMLRADEWARLTVQRKPVLLHLLERMDPPSEKRFLGDAFAKGLQAIAQRMGERLGPYLKAHPQVGQKALAHLDLPPVAALAQMDQALRREALLTQRPAVQPPVVHRSRPRA